MNGMMADSPVAGLFHREVDPFPEVLPLGGTAPHSRDSAGDIRAKRPPTNAAQPLFVSCLIIETAPRAHGSLYSAPSEKWTFPITVFSAATGQPQRVNITKT
jgi:hypothetical protein